MSPDTLLDLLADPDWNRCREAVRGAREQGWLRPADLAACCRAADAGARRRVLLLLGSLGCGQELVPAVTPCLDDACWPVREAAVLALGQLAASEAQVQTLLAARALRDLAPHVRAAAIPHLTEASLPAVEKALQQKRWKVRRKAVRAMAGLRGPEEQVAALLVRALDDVEARVRADAALGLGQRGVRGALPALLRRLGDAEERVRRAARQALRQLLAKDAGSLNLPPDWEEMEAPALLRAWLLSSPPGPDLRARLCQQINARLRYLLRGRPALSLGDLPALVETLLEAAGARAAHEAGRLLSRLVLAQSNEGPR